MKTQTKEKQSVASCDCFLSHITDRYPRLDEQYWDHQLYTAAEFIDAVNSKSEYDPYEVIDYINKIHPRWRCVVDVTC